MSAREPPYSQVPGPRDDGGGASSECEKLLTIAIARCGSFSAPSSSAGDTAIG